MSEYTPNTREVREYIRAADSVTAHMFSPDAIYAVEAFDRWLAAHDAEVRAEAESDPAKDERLVRYMAMVTPLGYQSALSVVQQMTLMIQAETGARRAGVVTEEPDWEYGYELIESDTRDVLTRSGAFESFEAAQHWAQKAHKDESDPDRRPRAHQLRAGTFRRVASLATTHDQDVERRVLPWVPVKQEGAETDG